MNPGHVMFLIGILVGACAFAIGLVVIADTRRRRSWQEYTTADHKRKSFGGYQPRGVQEQGALPSSNTAVVSPRFPRVRLTRKAGQ